MRLFYSNTSKSELIGYADAGYLSDPHKSQSQTCYVFTYGGIIISLHSMKKIIVSTSNNGEIIVIHEASRKCVWLRSMTQRILQLCGLSVQTETPTIFYKYNVACIAQTRLKKTYFT